MMIMKRILTVITAAAAAMLAFSCNKSQEGGAPEVAINGEGTLTVAAEGGQLEIGYSIKNPVDGGTVTAAADQDWVSIVDDKTEGKVTVSVAANTTADAREASVTVTYNYSDKAASVKVKIMQSGISGDVPAIVPETNEVSAFAEGGSYEFGYTVSNPVDGATVTVEPKESADWISGIDCATANVVKFTIAENVTSKARSAVLVLKYTYTGGEATAEVTVSQEASPNAGDYDVELVASVFDGIYYGSKWSKEAANYWIIVSDNGYTEDGYIKPNSKYFRFDIFGEFPENTGNIIVPEGTYTLDPSNYHGLGSMSQTFTIYIYSDEKGYSYSESYSDATLVVTRDGNDYVFDFTATGEDGKTYHAYYKGPQIIEDATGGEGPSDESTIDGDYQAEFTGSASATFWGDRGDGIGHWTLETTPEGSVGDGMGLDLYSASAQYGDFPTGTFTVSNSSAANTLTPGSISGNRISGSALHIYELEGLITGFALFNEGTVTISKSGSTYTIAVDVKDELGHKVTGQWSGKISSVNESSSPAMPAGKMLIGRR